MQLDIRVPIGFMFTLLGAILSVYGLFTASDKAAHERSLGININLWWGLFILAFGVVMLLLAYFARKKQPSPPADQRVKEDVARR
jgi:heme/copper-type cytochrome/quinol oxidase subunit 2